MQAEKVASETPVPNGEESASMFPPRRRRQKNGSAALAGKKKRRGKSYMKGKRTKKGGYGHAMGRKATVERLVRSLRECQEGLEMQRSAKKTHMCLGEAVQLSRQSLMTEENLVSVRVRNTQAIADRRNCSGLAS